MISSQALHLPPAALSAALAALDREPEALLAAAAGQGKGERVRIEQLLTRIPQILTEMQAQIARGMKVLAEAKHVTQAREAMRQLLADGTIVLTPDATRSALTGHVMLKDLGEIALDLAGVRRQPREAARNIGRGDRNLHQNVSH